MFTRIMMRIRRLVLERQYVVTLHAYDELDDDNISVYDLERIVLTGEIIERQRDRVTSQAKYRIRGQTIDGSEAEALVRVAISNKIVFLTVYQL